MPTATGTSHFVIVSPGHSGPVSNFLEAIIHSLLRDVLSCIILSEGSMLIDKGHY